MAKRHEAGDWERFFGAVHQDLLSAWLELVMGDPAVRAAIERVPRTTHRRVISAALRTFGRAMDAGFSPKAHEQIERQLVRGGYLETFALTDIANAYRIFLSLIHDELDRFFARRSVARRVAMWRAVEEVMFANFARIATTRVQLETDALAESEARFRMMLDMAGDAIGLADAKTRQIVYANGQMGQMFGAQPEAMLDLKIEDLLPARVRPGVRKRLTLALDRPLGEPWVVRRRFLRQTGETFDGALSVVRTQRRGAPARFLAVLRDVSVEQARAKALRAHSAQMRKLNEIGCALTATFDRDEILRRIITSVRELVPCGAASLLLKQGELLVFQEALGPKGSAVKRITLAPGQGLAGWVVDRGETAVVADAHADDRLDRSIEASVNFRVRNVLCVPLRAEGRVLGAIEMLNRRGGAFTQSDVEVAEAFAAFAAIALDKAQLFAERATLRQQLLQAEAATHAGRLASTIAQEMIDPITILKNNQAILAGQSAGSNGGPLGIMGEELVRLEEIIRLLIDYSNATAESVRSTPLPLLVADLARTLRPELEAAGVDLAVEQPKHLPPVAAVPHQVQVALANLLRHAIHVTPAGETAHVRLRRRGEMVQVSVSDGGAPLSRQQIDTLFDPTAVQKGILAKGLGLYIASAIVRHHGAELYGRGNQSGTTFTFSLPVTETEDAAWLTR